FSCKLSICLSKLFFFFRYFYHRVFHSFPTRRSSDLELSKRQNYKLLSGSVIPRPIAFVTSQDKNGKLNAAPFSFFNVVNSAPPMIMISTGRSEGKRKDTSLNIEETENFVVHITDETNVEQINRTAAPLDRTENELERTALTLVDS